MGNQNARPVNIKVTNGCLSTSNLTLALYNSVFNLKQYYTNGSNFTNN